MLFNSHIFILAFLPIALFGYYGMRRFNDPRVSRAYLVLASLFFYGWWNPRYVPLLLASIAFNYALGRRQEALRAVSGRGSKGLMWVGVGLDFALLGYFKYANFFVDTVNFLGGSHFGLASIAMPLAISFHTFQQVGYLVDAYEGKTSRYHWLDYLLFVTFFPQLIAGPIVLHQELLPQFEQPKRGTTYEDLALGLTLFVMGLGKKILLADRIAPYADSVFNSTASGTAPHLTLAWAGALAYSLQIYFDFSGYSDMAIGLARLFGIRLPLNFDSPYKAANIIEFWRRWHMTLSRFLRDYLYIRLGGNRKGKTRRFINLFATMVLGGLWHGAGWTFVCWGALHGIYLIFNHLWRLRRPNLGPSLAGRSLTFLCVVTAWVFFRADSWSTGGRILAGMAGFNGVSLPQTAWRYLGRISPWWVSFTGTGLSPAELSLMIALLAIAFFLPNSQQILARAEPALEQVSVDFKRAWRPNPVWAALTGFLFALELMQLCRISQFIYFQF